jgi:hypothetical protein
MRGDRKCSSEVRIPVERPHMRFILSCQTMMSTQVSPGTPGYGADKPFNSRCHEPTPAGEPELETRLFPRSLGRFYDGGARRDRTDDLMLAKHALYQLSYGPKSGSRLGWELSSISVCPPEVSHGQGVVGPGRLELPTSRLSGVCSNQLSYRPLKRSARTRRTGSSGVRMRDRTTAWSAAVFAERETKTATSRTCLVSLNEPIGSVSVLEVHP